MGHGGGRGLLPLQLDRGHQKARPQGAAGSEGVQEHIVMARKKSNPATKKRRNILPLVPLPTAISQTSEGYQVAKFLRTGKFNPSTYSRKDITELGYTPAQIRRAVKGIKRDQKADSGNPLRALVGNDIGTPEILAYFNRHDIEPPRRKQLEAREARELEARRAKHREFTGQNKRNPASEAIEAYTDFHGQEPSEMVKVTTQVHFHRHLAGAGDLKFLVIDTPNGKFRVTLKFTKGTLLAFNEKRNQLFVEGGDQSVDLRLFGIDLNDSHELETLGKATKIGYFTTKVHLAEEDGGTAVYEHKFRMTNQDGQHVTVRIARYPDVIYRVLDEHLEFSGGSYKILPEGIDK
jgi:hypothetical protein